MSQKKIVYSVYTPASLIVMAPFIMIAVSFIGAWVMTFLSKMVMLHVYHKPYYPIPFIKVWLVLSVLSMMLLYRLFKNEARNKKNPQMDFIRMVLSKTPGLTLDPIGITLDDGGAENVCLHARRYNKREITDALNKLTAYVLGEEYGMNVLDRGYLVALTNNGVGLSSVSDYSYKEFFFKRFVQAYLITQKPGEYFFFDVDYFIENSTKTEFMDFDIGEADIDDIFNPTTQPVKTKNIAMPIDKCR